MKKNQIKSNLKNLIFFSSLVFLDELNAKLVYAEALLIEPLLKFIKDQGLLSFISGALKIKECHDIFVYEQAKKNSILKYFVFEIEN